MTTTAGTGREVPQQAVQQAPCITFGQFRQAARQQGWSPEWLLEQVRGELEQPTEVLRRVLHGATVNGRHELLAEVVLPYACLIRLYQRAARPTPALAGEPACQCGCGGKLRGKQRYASPACRKRRQRLSEAETRAS
jgi:hypothetical protein